MHSRNFSLRKASVRRMYARPPLHISRGEILHFKQLRVSLVNSIASWTLREKNNNNNLADYLFRLNFNVFIDVDKRGRARARDKKQRRSISLKEKHKNFIAAVRKRGNASGHQGKNERHRKKSEQEHIILKRGSF